MDLVWTSTPFLAFPTAKMGETLPCFWSFMDRFAPHKNYPPWLPPPRKDAPGVAQPARGILGLATGGEVEIGRIGGFEVLWMYLAVAQRNVPKWHLAKWNKRLKPRNPSS